MGFGPQELGLMFTALALSQGLALPLGAWLADKTSGAKKMLVVPAGLISCAAFSSIAFATTPTHLFAAMAAQGVCSAFVQPAVGAFTAEVTPADKRGQAMSLQRQAGDVLALAGPISIGALADLTSTPTALLTGGGLMALCHVAYGVLAMPKEDDVQL